MDKYRETIINRVWERLLLVEGGYVNDPNDPGGETKFGISKRSYPHLDIKNLTEDDAKKIFIEDFFNPYFDLFPTLNTKCPYSYDPDYEVLFFTQFFAFLYNSTPQQTVKVLQKTINDHLMAVNPKLETKDLLIIDGVLGPNTEGMIYLCFNPKSIGLLSSIFISNICSKYTEFKNFDKYGKGWIRRVNRLIAGE